MGDMKNIGVVGCGLMGSGIAQVCAQAGYTTTVREIDQALLDKGLGSIASSLDRSVERGRLSPEDRDATLARLKGTTSLDALAGCDLVIEVITEDIRPKRQLFAELDALCQADAILATNTSSLTVVEMAAATKRPERVVGMHFFNPVPAMKLVEVVRTVVTSDEVVNQAKAFCESIGKTVVLAKDTPGFVVNRLLVPYLLDAIAAYEAGLASREDIDQGMVLGCGHPMGPLTLSDLVGLDTLYNVARSFYDELGGARFAPPPLLKRMVLAGHLGRKTGRGFYDYRQQ